MVALQLGRANEILQYWTWTVTVQIPALLLTSSEHEGNYSTSQSFICKMGVMLMVLTSWSYIMKNHPQSASKTIDDCTPFQGHIETCLTGSAKYY